MADLKEMDDRVRDKLIMIVDLKCGFAQAACDLWLTSKSLTNLQCLTHDMQKKSDADLNRFRLCRKMEAALC